MLQTLEASTGATWQVTIDPWSRVAVRGVGGLPGKGTPIAASEAQRAAARFLDRHGPLLGVSGGVELRRVHWAETPGAWRATWQQHAGTIPIEGCRLDLVLSADGDPVLFQSTLVPGVRLPATRGDAALAARRCEETLGEALVVESSRDVGWIDPRGGRYVARSATRLELRNEFGARWTALVEAESGEILELESSMRFEALLGTISGDIKPFYSQDPLEARPFPWLQVQLGNPETASTYTGADGRFVFASNPGNVLVRAQLNGQWVTVTNELDFTASPGLAETVSVPSDVQLRIGAGESRDDERTIYYHVNVIHDYAREAFGFALLDYPLPAVAHVRNPANGNMNYANAFWDGNRIAFGNGGGVYENFGLFADVIYHEYVHAMTDFMYRPGGGLRGAIGGAIHEGLSDYFACTITNEPLLGENLVGLGAFRDLENRRQWPRDRDPGDEEHSNGEIFAGSLWRVRARAGAEVTDKVVHFARTQFPQDFDAYLEAMLVEDDLIYGDGSPGNGSPHREAILGGFAEHGIGPLAGQPLRMAHTPLTDIEDPAPRQIVASSAWALPTDRMELRWRANDGNFALQDMVSTGVGVFAGEIPSQPEGTVVEYWLRATRSRPFEEDRLPEGAPASVFSYRVGPDLTPPTIAHTATPQLPAFSWPAALAMTIEDNLGVAHAWVEHSLNGEPQGTLGLVFAPDEPTVFRTRFPGNGGQIGDVIEYAIHAVDASRAGNTIRVPETGTFRIDLVENLADGFEGTALWVHQPVIAGRPDAWHKTTAHNRTPNGAAAWWCGNEAGEYPVRAAAELITDWYDVHEGARASIWSWMDAEVNIPPLAFDGGIIELQVEGALGWQSIVPIGGYTHQMSATSGTNYLAPGTPCLSGLDPDWRELEFDLAPWAGQKVRLRFLFASDDSPAATPRRGWLLDDFFLAAGTPDPTDVPANGAPRPAKLLVHPPGPNPFNPTLVFQLDVPETAGRVLLDIFDVGGRRVTRLLDSRELRGARRVIWDGKDGLGRAQSSGVYVYRVQSDLGTETGKVSLVR